MSTAENLLDGQLAHVATVALNRTGKKPSPATVWRWCKRGLRGGTIKLQAIYHSGYWQTTPEAFNAFLKAQTEAAKAGNSGDATDESLKAAGLLQ
ncbi:DUF1580 domain-containing protein [Thalassoglobus polymorphus]|uniref:DUF1580 domain-containing protein n=1 Tax=Thalassoglobus polymorphus TaxID=2527994 RepID=A0A517QR43_9PLAN|nr:DUF1580 domain-containing protein [Thalassoglobus polymorphus]QDT34083.1 hypothetical protein Mal48_33430 [Thalassoglobus polymorphus]